jgi:membrane protease YdiL (CAAX protease family)
MIISAGLGIAFLTVGALSQEQLVFFGQVISALAVTLSVFVARGYFDRRSFTSLGLAWNRQATLDLIVGLAIPALLMGIVFFVYWGLGWLRVEGFTWDGAPPAEIGRSLVDVLILFLLVGWSEELLFRGYWLQNLAEGLNSAWGVILSSGVFALFHLANPGANWASTLGLTFAGLFLAYGYTATRSLWLPIGLHIGWNFFEGPVFGFPVSGLETFRLLKTTLSGPALLTGGAFGPEAGLILPPILLLGAGLIALYAARRNSPPDGSD